jgi:hypothetical protein
MKEGKKEGRVYKDNSGKTVFRSSQMLTYKQKNWRTKVKLMGNIYKMMSWQGILTSHKTQAGRNTQPQALQDVSVCMDREASGCLMVLRTGRVPGSNRYPLQSTKGQSVSGN